MACGGCSKRRAAAASAEKNIKLTYMDGYQMLNPSVVKNRLESYKRKFCSSCVDKYKCDMDMYLKCPNRNN